MGRTWGLAALLIVALALRLPHLGESLWLDETYATAAKLGSTSRLLATLRSDVHPPAYGLLMAGWIRLFGDSEISIRIPPLIAGLATLPLLLGLGRRLVGQRAAWIAVIALALSPVHVEFSREARPYALSVLLVVAAMLAWTKAESGEARRGLLAFVVLGSLACATHWFAAPIVGTALLLSAARRRTRLRVVLALLATALPAALFLALQQLVKGVELGRGHLRAFGLAEAWELFGAWMWGGGVLRGPLLEDIGLASALVAALLFVRGLGVDLVARRAPGAAPRGTLAIGALAIPALLAAFTLLGLDRTYVDRSALPALPFVLLAIARGATSLRAPASTIAIGFVLGWALFVAAVHAVDSSAWRNHDWRGAAAILAAEERAARAGEEPRIRLLFEVAPWGAGMSHDRPEIGVWSGLTGERRRLDRIRRGLERLPDVLRRPLDAVVTDLFAEVEADARAENERILLWRRPVADESLARAIATETVAATDRFYVVAHPGQERHAPLAPALASAEWTARLLGEVRGLRVWRFDAR